MAFEGTAFDSLDAEHVLALRDHRVIETRTLDYKLQLPGKTDADRKEFLADVSSFANAAGGHIIFGVQEKEGVPVAIPGLTRVNPDAAIQDIESRIRALQRMPEWLCHRPATKERPNGAGSADNRRNNRHAHAVRSGRRRALPLPGFRSTVSGARGSLSS